MALRILSRPGLIAQLQFEPRDVWIGLFWRRTEIALHLYVCVLPLMPLHITIAKERTMKFRIRELTPGYWLEVGVPAVVSFPPEYAEAAMMRTVIMTWIPVGHPYGSEQACHAAAEQFARRGNVVEEFDVEPVAARA